MEKHEIWKPISDFEGYKVSNKGQVRSYFAKTGQRTWGIVDTPQRVLKPSKDLQGYLGINLRKDGVTYRKRIHQLVLLALVGPCPDGLEACHNNGIRGDNRLENLRYDTHSENMRDVTRNNSCSLSMQDVKDIRRRKAACETHAQIAKDYSVSLSIIVSASTGASYKCVDADAPPVNDHRIKLTPEQVLIIKWLLSNETILRKDIAERFGVHASTITRIANGAVWGHVVLPANGLLGAGFAEVADGAEEVEDLDVGGEGGVILLFELSHIADATQL